MRRLLLTCLLLAGPSLHAQAPKYDLVIRGGAVIDGTGAPRYRADVAVRGDRIALVSRTGIPAADAARAIDARGLVVAPGFIDAHAHVEELPQRPLAEGFTRQGVTSVVYAADGGMPWPLRENMVALQRGGHVPNIAYFAGFNTIRSLVLGPSTSRAPSPAELERMQALVAQAMAEGAIGLSAGLRYVPASYASPEEVIALARVAAASGGFYSSHMRDEGEGVIEGVRETIRIAREAGMPAVLSHHKIMGSPQWGWSTRTLALVDSASAAGLKLGIDQYAYDATQTNINVLFPAWSLAGGRDSLQLRLADPPQRARIEEGIRSTFLEERGGGDLERVRFTRYAGHPAWNGLTWAAVARERGRRADLEFAIELAIEVQLNGGANAVWQVVSEEDIRRIMQHPLTMVSSDGGIMVPGHGHPHPRGNGAFARVLGRYVREQHLLTLEEAVRKMTSLTADWLGWRERGRLAEGMKADIAVFDPQRVSDRATYEDPHQYAVGVEYVLVNGVPVLWDGSLTGEKPGRVLLRHGQELARD